MSDAYGTVPSYPSRTMSVSSVRPLSGGALGTGGDSLVQHAKEANQAARGMLARQKLALRGVPEPPSAYEEMPASIVREAMRSAERAAAHAGLVGGVFAVVVSIVFYVISGSGAVITLVATISGVLAGSLLGSSRRRTRRLRRKVATRSAKPLGAGQRQSNDANATPPQP